MTVSPAADCDFTDPQLLAEPHACFDRLRREEPVHWSERLGAWVVTSREHVLTALRNPALSNDRVAAIVGAQLGEEHAPLAADFARIVGAMMLMHDGAAHHRLRVLGNHGFVPTLMRRMRPMIQQRVDELLDDAAPRGAIDIVADLAQPLPAGVIAGMFGLPPENRRMFQRASDAMAKFFGSTLGDPAEDARDANAAALELEAFFRKLLDERRRHPTDDLMSLFLTGNAAGELSPDEICGQCVLLLVAGHVTTIDQLANAVHALVTHGDQWQRLQQAPELLPTAIEEILRFDTAVPFVNRAAKQEVTLGGRTIRAGQLVYLALLAANHDPAVFNDPHRFDILRDRKEIDKHLAFGQGPHICLGGNLARLELEVALSTLLKRFRHLWLDPAEPPIRNCQSLTFRGFRSLHVQWE
jgi:cytochrome P450